MENWKDVKGFEGLYQVSDQGRIKRTTKNRCLKKSITVHGYERVTLSKAGEISYHYVHRLLADHFIENPRGHNIVDHINIDRSDNRLDNLRWVSSSENSRNAHRCSEARSKYNGVYKNTNCSTFVARIFIDGVGIHIGSFRSEVVAGLAFDDYVVQNNLDRELNFMTMEDG